MNGKSEKYRHLKNDKSLIGGKMPNDLDFKNFERWKKMVRSKRLQLIIFSSSFIIFIYIIFFVTGVFADAELKEKIFGILCFFVFAFFEYFLIKQYLVSKSMKMEYCNYGKVIDKYKVVKGKRKKYCIIVEVNDNTLKFNSKYEYWLLNINDEVMVFSVEGQNKAYVTQKN